MTILDNAKDIAELIKKYTTRNSTNALLTCELNFYQKNKIS